MIKDVYSITMTSLEIELLSKYLGGCQNYLEFGAGSSTSLAVNTDAINRIVSVESNKVFAIETLLSHEYVNSAFNSGRLEFIFIDIGEIRSWGRPSTEIRKFMWPAYYLAPFINRSYKFDVVLIDGIFRGACALTSLSENPDCKLLIHDFWNRPRYHYLLKFIEPEDRADTFGAFRLRRNVNLKEISRIIKKYGYRPDDETDISRIKRKFLL